MTPAQLATIKAFILADPVLVTKASGPGTDYGFIADALNADFSPAYWVLKTVLNLHDLTDKSGIDTDGSTVTNFVFGGASGGLIARSQGEREVFFKLFNQVDNIIPALANIRTAIDDIFSGAGAGAVANRAHFRAVSRRKAHVLEKLFVVATVGGPTQTGARGAATNPDTLVVETTVGTGDIGAILA